MGDFFELLIKSIANRQKFEHSRTGTTYMPGPSSNNCAVNTTF